MYAGSRPSNPNSYRAGQIHGHDLPKLIPALLFVAVEKNAPGAARFANGDWSQVGLIMPIVTRLVAATGWSSYVMQKFLTLCERAGVTYPLDAFADQANAVLGSIANAKGSWAGTMLPARTAAVIQRLADASFPLRADQAQELLKALDARAICGRGSPSGWRNEVNLSGLGIGLPMKIATESRMQMNESEH
jgi:hypothetical protein